MLALRLLFWLLFGTWTWLLVKANPVPEAILSGLPNWFDPAVLHFILAKTLHLSVYAFFSLYACWLTSTSRGRRWVWALMIAHGIGTELGQMIGAKYFETNRYGCVRDMVIDAIGVSVGAALVRLIAPLRPRAS